MKLCDNSLSRDASPTWFAGIDDSPQAKAVVADAVVNQEVTSKGQMQSIPVKTLTLEPMKRTKMGLARDSIVSLSALL
jgi:hypothetical protein